MILALRACGPLVGAAPEAVIDREDDMGWIDRQLPQQDEIFFDHAGFFVPDIQASAAVFERLGFVVSAVNIHHNANAEGKLVAAGTANRLLTFRRGYLELLGAVEDTPLADQLRAGLARYAGLHLLAFTHPDAASQAERLARAGFALQPTVRLRRPTQTPDGERTARFTVVRAAPGVFPEGRVQMLTHEAPELVWRPDLVEHPNRADALTDVLVVCEAPRTRAEAFARFAAGALAPEGALQAVSLARGRLTFAGPEAARRLLPSLTLPPLPCIAAVAVASADLDESRRLLAARGVRPLADRERLLCVGPADAAGAYLLFHTPDLEPVWSSLGG
jgi:hypothetical protein